MLYPDVKHLHSKLLLATIVIKAPIGHQFRRQYSHTHSFQYHQETNDRKIVDCCTIIQVKCSYLSEVIRISNLSDSKLCVNKAVRFSPRTRKVYDYIPILANHFNKCFTISYSNKIMSR